MNASKENQMTKYAKEVAAAGAPDEERTLTLAEARRLPGLFGRVAPAMLARHGVYAYVEVPSERKVLLRLAR